MMKKITHHSAKPSHYNKESAHYDAFNEKNSEAINQLLENLLKRYRVKSVFDMTCGTGSQVFWLKKRGFDVIGCDINAKMLHLAKAKARKEKLKLQFIKGDIRYTKVGQFDAAISIANAIGHLTRSDFEKAIRNIYNNLNTHGLYIFDIFNLEYLLDKDNITQLTIDWQTQSGKTKAREIQYSTITEDGILASYDIYHEQTGKNKPKISKAFQTLQIYSAHELKQMLEENGFKILRQSAIDGSKFIPHKTERILTVARKR